MMIGVDQETKPELLTNVTELGDVCRNPGSILVREKRNIYRITMTLDFILSGVKGVWKEGKYPLLSLSIHTHNIHRLTVRQTQTEHSPTNK